MGQQLCRTLGRVPGTVGQGWCFVVLKQLAVIGLRVTRMITSVEHLLGILADG